MQQTAAFVHLDSAYRTLFVFLFSLSARPDGFYYNTDTPIVSFAIIAVTIPSKRLCMNGVTPGCKSLLVGWLVDRFFFFFLFFLSCLSVSRLAAPVNLVCIGFPFFFVLINN